MIRKCLIIFFLVLSLFLPILQSPAADEQTMLLIHSNTMDGSTVFIDSSPQNRVITPAGNVKHSTAQSIFTKSSIYFDGTGDYLELADSDDWYLDQGDWTIDFRMRPDDNAAHALWGQVEDTGTANTRYFLLYLDGNNRLVFGHYYKRTWRETETYREEVCVTNCDRNCCKWVTKHRQVTKTEIKDGNFTSSGQSINPNQWHHVAVVRSQNNVTLYLNGTAVGTNPVKVNYNQNAPFRIGVDGIRSGFKGYMAEFRVSKGIARWTANFTPPVNAYDAVTAALAVDKTTMYYGQNALLTWNTTNVATGDACSIDPGIGAVAANGSQTIQPAPGNNTYTLTIEGPLNTATSSVTVNALLDPAVGYIDTDHDGLNDVWELLHYGDLRYGRDDDPDHDGFGNYLEMLAGSDPNDAGSKPQPGSYYEYDAIGRIKKIHKVK